MRSIFVFFNRQSSFGAWRHRLFASSACLVLSALAFVLGGCYTDRWTGNYMEFPELTEIVNTQEDTNVLSEGEKALNKEILREQSEIPMEPYTINAGDTIDVTVYNHSDIGGQTVVAPDGHIGLVHAGQVHVAGKTLEGAAKLIEEKLEAFIRNPVVGISLRVNRSESVTIAGACARPGMYTISKGMRLADVYAMAGGSSTRYFDGQQLDAADLEHSKFTRNGQTLPINFREAIEKGDLENNIYLRKGDYIYIAVRSESMVCLIGDVGRPHKRLWDKNLGMLELLATGGGLRETHWSHAIILRGGADNPQLFRVDLDGILRGSKPNVFLKSGDFVYIPHDNASEFNVFIRKVLPSGQLFNMIATPYQYYHNK